MTGDRLRSLGRQHGVYLAALLAVTAAMFFLWGNVNWHIPPADRWDNDLQMYV